MNYITLCIFIYVFFLKLCILNLFHFFCISYNSIIQIHHLIHHHLKVIYLKFNTN